MTFEVEKTAGDSEWFTHDRFGMFIHWGLYSLAARHEWLQSREKLSGEQYSQKYFKRFDPDLYDPDLWAQLASDAGMKYFVVTTKHHEGFCLWDSKLTDYKATNSPAGRDVLRPMVDAFRKRDMKVGLYYSLLDWHHPHYTVDPKHPLRFDANNIAGNTTLDFTNYRNYLYGQTKELLTDFGQVDLLFYDFSFPEENGLAGKGKEDWGSEELVRMIRTLQPNILLNDRLQVGGDITTPEQYMPTKWVQVNGKRVVWETCHTFSGSWGYHREEESWKSVELLIKMMIDTVSKGGNLLLNVGPTGRGEFDERAVDRLKGMGEWMKRHNRSIYGCTQAPDTFVCPDDCRLTYNPQLNRMYVHVYSWPFKNIHLHGFAGKVEYAQFLNDASEIRFKEGFVPSGMDNGAFKEGRDEHTVTLSLPVKKPNVTVPVIELFLK
ncbi:alpha-L-fucosidase [Paenibacillus sp. Soil724D2]|uniref:alpha-L-fucosidase n=1 Tax=Paenibacillus sp. (strain Soil724D2) TaxID=1736392 RepID=UPI000715316E|nr:alpha-L-fucosidase [Paenibacillus sp. Soil724D2]KRE32318.1 alpha-L-fucosidase [Paenibacillus sp. Soil724D2]